MQSTERLVITNEDGAKVPLAGVWKQAKCHLTGEFTVTEEMAELFKPGNELRVVVFPTDVFPPRPKTPVNKNDAPPEAA
jgi:hypothetical protein